MSLLLKPERSRKPATAGLNELEEPAMRRISLPSSSFIGTGDLVAGRFEASFTHENVFRRRLDPIGRGEIDGTRKARDRIGRAPVAESQQRPCSLDFACRRDHVLTLTPTAPLIVRDTVASPFRR
jgi:hypothetical protein